MGKYWGGKKTKMHSTIIKELGPFDVTHLTGQEPSMQFSENDGPFYLSPEDRFQNKNEVPTGQQVTRQKTKPELMSDLKRAGFSIKGRYTMDKLKQQARRFNVPLTIIEEVISNLVGSVKIKVFCKINCNGDNSCRLANAILSKCLLPSN